MNYSVITRMERDIPPESIHFWMTDPLSETNIRLTHLAQLLPPAHVVCVKVMFSVVSVILSVHGGPCDITFSDFFTWGPQPP